MAAVEPTGTDNLMVNKPAAAPVVDKPAKPAAPVAAPGVAAPAVAADPAAARKKVHDDFMKDREAQIKANNEKMEADAKLRPTPSIEEVARAMAGVDGENVPDGSPEQDIHHVKKDPGYMTRDSEAKK